MSNYVKEWCFTSGGECFNLTKISSINKYEHKTPVNADRYVVVLNNKENLLIDKKDAVELIQALKQREVDIEEHITGRLKEMMEDCK